MESDPTSVCPSCSHVIRHPKARFCPACGADLPAISTAKETTGHKGAEPDSAPPKSVHRYRTARILVPVVVVLAAGIVAAVLLVKGDDRQGASSTTVTPTIESTVQQMSPTPSLPLQRSPTLSLPPQPVAATKVGLFRVFRAQSEEIVSRFRVAEEGPGSCLTVSRVRGDAWTCTSARGSNDPCFASSTAPEIVACVPAPWSRQVTLILLAQPLPAGNPYSDEDLSDRPPWGLELENGERCLRIDFMSFDIGGLRVNYFCGDIVESGQAEGGYVVGDIDRAQGLWRVFYTNDPDGQPTQVGVIRAWH